MNDNNGYRPFGTRNEQERIRQNVPQETAVLGSMSAEVEKKRRINKERRIRRAKQRQSRRTFAHILGSILLVSVIVCISSFLAYVLVRGSLDFTGISREEFEVDIEIPKNATVDDVSEILTANGIISYPEFFVFYANQQDSQVYNDGVFTFSSAMTYNAIIERLQSVSNATKVITIRIQEGMTAREIGALLEENSICRASDFEKYYKNKLNKFSFEKRVTHNAFRYFQLEGYLFPDTYEFYVNDSLDESEEDDLNADARLAAETMYNNFNQRFTKAMYKTINEMGLTLDEFVTLASMVQLEAGTVEEMGLVASVFLNRIRESDVFPYLQSDVTHIYADKFIKPDIDSYNSISLGNIIKMYNTYESPGIPPGAVCNPGMDAMMALIEAPQTDYYYFCSNEETLETFFATTLEEHEQNLISAGLVPGNN